MVFWPNYDGSDPEQPPKRRNPFSGGSKGTPRVGDCGCGGKQEAFKYVRFQARGSGAWICMDCNSRVLPNVAQGCLTAAQTKALEGLKALYSNDGWGDLNPHEPVIACAWPAGTTYTKLLVE